MILDPRLPGWSYGHSDYAHICAHPRNSSHVIYRFDDIIPKDWIQVKCVDCEIHPPELPLSKKETGLSLVALVHR